MNCPVYFVGTGLANTCGQLYPAAQVPCYSNNVAIPWPVSTGHVYASGALGQNGNNHRAGPRSRAGIGVGQGSRKGAGTDEAGGNGSTWADKVRGHEVRAEDNGAVHDDGPGNDHFTTQTAEKVENHTKMRDNAQDLLRNIEIVERFVNFLSNEVDLANHTIDKGNEGDCNNMYLEYMFAALINVFETVLKWAQVWIQQNTLTPNRFTNLLCSFDVIRFVNTFQKDTDGLSNVSGQRKQLKDVDVLKNCKGVLQNFKKGITWELQAHDAQERNNLHTQQGDPAATLTSVDPERFIRQAAKYSQEIQKFQNGLLFFHQDLNIWTGNFKREETLPKFDFFIDSLITIWNEVIELISDNTPEFQGKIRELNSVDIKKYVKYTIGLDEHNIHELYAEYPQAHSEQVRNCFRVLSQLDRLIKWLFVSKLDPKMRKQPPNTMLPYMYQTIDIQPVKTILDNVCTDGYDKLEQYAHWKHILYLYVQGRKIDAQWRREFNFPDVNPENYKGWFNQLTTKQKEKVLNRALDWAYAQ